MSVETPNRLLATGLFAPVVPAGPFTDQVIAGKGVKSFTRSAAGQYIIELEQPLTFHEGDVRVSGPPNTQLIMSGQILPDGTIFVTALTLGTGVPIDPPWFALQVTLWNEGAGAGVAVPALPIPPPIPGGGGATGPARAVAYYDPLGNNSGDPALLGDQPDAFQRPQINDFRVGGTGRGAVYRLGRWGMDGDAQNVASEGYITYGPNALGNGPSLTDGALGFYEPNGFGVLDAIVGVNGGNPFYLCGFEDGGPFAPFGLDGFIINDNTNNRIFQVKRSGLVPEIFGRTFMTAGGSVWSSGAFANPNTNVTGSPGDYYLSTTGGVAATFWVKETGAATNTGWVAFGVSLVGANDALVYLNPTGTAAATNAALVAGSLDPFGLPQIWDYRVNGGGSGAKWRQGAWQQDGDPTNVTGEGHVVYGASAQGLGPNATDGGYARIKSNRFGLANVINGVNGNALFYYFRVDPTSLFLADDTDTKTAEIVRATGDAFFTSVRVGGAAGPKWSSGAGDPNVLLIPGTIGDIFSNTAGGAGTTFWVKEAGAPNTTGGWASK
jgi:hypothetical protein